MDLGLEAADRADGAAEGGDGSEDPTRRARRAVGAARVGRRLAVGAVRAGIYPGPVVEFANGAVGAGGDQIFLEVDQTLSSSYSVTAGKNALTAGPLEIATGQTLTIPSGSNLVIV